ncbi:4Fe-4S dicluster domain-containing protein [Desulfosporosinus sp.]|uniref:4Fe-4S dicluster domain-containing protein n=1 Tax=Desulfosporosinus sp. TaxID=157907 RepID=UPI000E7FA5D6|nr:4Fe-4S dicluster domain-containing protein [Desulfosporosinus sp.]MBC2723002.1 4Fe-4S dicluster domain-containing protein [Desulfosporosinus sp.]MBC2728057.1 4Fe-4S dicluster domain-containing protein [Desulfosporosinus sp.]HBV86127.1 hydrogenase [Desulfosporosinus sp.]
MSQYAMLVDVSRCIGCKSCTVACMQENGLQSGDSWLRVRPRELLTDHLVRYYIPQSCRHCSDPICVAVCPIGAIKCGEDGLVIHDIEKCIGCQVCVTACLHGGMKIMNNGKVGKCSFCSHLLQRGKEPACVTVCPVDARVFGEREVLIREAGLRMTDLISKGTDVYIKGTENDLTKVLYLLLTLMAHTVADSKESVTSSDFHNPI